MRLFGGGLDGGADGALGNLGHPPVGAVAEDLVAFEFGEFHVTGEGDALAGLVDFAGDLEGGLEGVGEDGYQQLNDVFVGVLFIVPDDDVIVGLLLGFFFFLGDALGLRRRFF